MDYNRRAAAAAIASIAYEEAIARFSTALELGIADAQVRGGCSSSWHICCETRAVSPRRGRSLSRASQRPPAASTWCGGAPGRLTRRRADGRPRVDPRQMVEPPRRMRSRPRRVERQQAASPEQGRVLALALRRQGRLAAALGVSERALPQAEISGGSGMLRRRVSARFVMRSATDRPVASRSSAAARSRARVAATAERSARQSQPLSSARNGLYGVDDARELVSAAFLRLRRGRRQNDVWAYRTLAAKVRERIGDLEAAREEFARVHDFFATLGAFEPDARACTPTLRKRISFATRAGGRRPTAASTTGARCRSSTTSCTRTCCGSLPTHASKRTAATSTKP